MRIQKESPESSFGSNSYLVYDSGDAYIIDAPPSDVAFDEIIKRDSLKLRAVLLTHAHFDHILGLSKLIAKYPDTRIFFSIKDAPFIKNNSKLNREFIKSLMGIDVDESEFMGIEERIESYEESAFKVGPFKVFPSPGHSEGSVLIYLKEDNALFTGDTLFRGSIGRTDFVMSSYKDMIKSLDFLKNNFPDSTLIYPGHEESSTLLFEKNHNPYLM